MGGKFWHRAPCTAMRIPNPKRYEFYQKRSITRAEEKALMIPYAKYPNAHLPPRTDNHAEKFVENSIQCQMSAGVLSPPGARRPIFS